ncbi:MAG: hypothetical protein LLG14_12890 [Nocardiaceae bacterium]|nr:hypothetical protein [Nocardiaceae bacterium]
MTWADVHARYDILDTVLEHADIDPAGAVADAFAGHPDAARLFGSAEGIRQALQARWTNHLNAKLDYAIEKGIEPAWAWQQLKAEQPRLRAVLDRTVIRELVAA